MAPKGDLWFIVEPRLTKAGSWLNYRDSRGNRRSLTTAHPEGETGWTQLEPPPTNISPTFLDQ